MGGDLAAKARAKVAAARAKAAGRARSQRELETARRQARSRALEPGHKLAIRWVNEFMLDHPEQIFNIKASLEADTLGSARAQKRRKAESDSFDPDAYKVFKQIPKYFLGTMLMEYCSFAQEEIDCIDFAASGAIRFLVAFFFGILDSTPVPKVLGGSKLHLTQFSKVRHERLGNRGSLWRNRGLVTEDFTIDWSKGVYTIKMDGDGEQVETITHITGVVADVSDYVIKPEDDFAGNHSDMHAYFKKGRQDLNLHQFFAAEDVEHFHTKEAIAVDAQRAMDLLKITESVKDSIASASSSEVFSMAKAHADLKRKEAMQKKGRVPKKGLAAPLSEMLPAPTKD